ncbi:MAG: hypothetical protein PVG39_08830 [Desulfobacteraceae bacterium]|jgi:hypothetical protein
MDINLVRHINALMDLNTALFKGLETALYIIEEWDNIPEHKREEIIASLNLIIENNRACFTATSVLH